MILSLIVSAAISQCQGGTCKAPAAAQPSYSFSYSYQAPGYSASYSETACTTQRRGFFKRLFKRNR